MIEKLSDAYEWLEEMIHKQSKTPLFEDPVFKTSDVENKLKRVDSLYTKVQGISKPKEKNNKFKNIKIDNITIDGNEGDYNWEDFIKINNGGEDEEKPKTN